MSSPFHNWTGFLTHRNGRENPISSPGRFSLAFPGAPPPKPGKSALGTRLKRTHSDKSLLLNSSEHPPIQWCVSLRLKKKKKKKKTEKDQPQQVWQGRAEDWKTPDSKRKNKISYIAWVVKSYQSVTGGSFDIFKTFSTIASLGGHKPLYSFSLFVSSKTRHHAEFLLNFPLNTVTSLKQ